MKVLVASVTNRGPEIIAPHIASIKALEVPPKTEISLAYISDGAPNESLMLLEAAGARVALAQPKPPDASYAVTEVTHHWSLGSFAFLAREKQRLMDLAVEEGFDAIFLVDSDLVLGPETLASLVSAQKPVVSAVFWTKWQPEAPPMPQTWLSHPYDFTGRSGTTYLKAEEFLQRLSSRALLEVGGLGACTLIRTDVIRDGRAAFWPLLEGLPQGGMWQGEDRHFCVRAAHNHVSMWTDAWSDIVHLYRPSDVENLEALKATHPKRKEIAAWGDDVSIIIEALEEPELAKMGRREHLRGRVGQLRLLPDLEDAVLATRVGSERIVKVRFPMWWSTKHLQGQTRNVMLRVVDVKEHRRGD